MPWTEFSFILKPSQISGIGVFATHDISKGTILFSGTHVQRKLNRKDIPAEFLSYCVLLNDEECIAPERFDRIEIGWYLNHSNEPNVAIMSDYRMVAIHDIKAGDEIFVDYNELKEPEHLRDDYYTVRTSKS